MIIILKIIVQLTYLIPITFVRYGYHFEVSTRKESPLALSQIDVDQSHARFQR